MNNRIFYHVRLPSFTVPAKCEYCGKETRFNIGANNPLFTLGFHYNAEWNLLFIAWAKPMKDDNYIKSFGINIINNRLDRLIENYPNISYKKNMPRIVKKYLNFYINKVRKYFKEMNDKTTFFI